MTLSKSNTAHLASLIATALLMVFIGCVDAPVLLEEEVGSQDAPIVNGSVDTGHPAVGALHSGNKAACTATLVGKRTVLTAAHCVSSKDKPYKLYSPIHFYIGKLYYGTKYTAVSATMHPNYAGGNKSDLAVLILNKDVTGVTPIPVAKTPPHKGETIMMIGYGKTGENGLGFGTKRKATNTIKSTTSTTYSMYGSSGSVGNICNGDSGGPSLAIRGGLERVIGVHSTKRNYCGWGATDMRTDSYYSWIYAQAKGDLYDGGALDNQPPSLAITSPSAGATVGSNFTVSVSATDNVGVSRVVLYLNAQKLGELTKAPYQFQLTQTPWGTHTVEAVAHDAAGYSASVSISLLVKNSTTPTPPKPKPLGGSCSADNQCGSQMCMTVSATAGYCTRKCTNNTQCMTGFSCTNNVCLKGQNNGGNNGGNNNGGNNGGNNNGGNNNGGPATKAGYGDSCTAPSSCASGLCARDMTNQQLFCTKMCDINSQTNSCGQGSACMPAGGGKAVCGLLHDAPADFQPSSAGCSFTGATSSSQSSGSMILLLGLALCLLGARRIRVSE